MYHICWFEQTFSPGWRSWEEKDRGQVSGPSEICRNAAIDFSGVRILARVFLQNQHLHHIFHMDITVKEKKEEMLFPQQRSLLKQIITLPRHSCYRKGIPAYLGLYQVRPLISSTDWNSPKSRISGVRQQWRHQKLFHSLGQAQFCSSPITWQSPATTTYPSSLSTPGIALTCCSSEGNIYSSPKPLQLTIIFMMALDMRHWSVLPAVVTVLRISTDRHKSTVRGFNY